MPRVDQHEPAAVSEITDSFLRGNSLVAGSPTGLLKGHYGLAIVSPSWESRSVAVTDAVDITIDTLIVLTFRDGDPTADRLNHERKVTTFAESVDAEVIEIQASTAGIEKDWVLIEEALVEHLGRHDRIEDRFLVDIGSCPRFHSLAFVAAVVRLGVLRQIDLFYPEVEYLPADGDDPGELFTLGRWELVGIPGLEGSYAPAFANLMVLGLGFEGSKTLRVVSSEEPEELIVVLGDPGTSPGYVERAMETNKYVLDRYSIGDSDIVRAGAADLVGTWRALTSIRDRFTDRNCSFVCSGTKAQSVGMALAALSDGRPAVLYNLPGSYRETPTRLVGQYWLSTITDLTSATLRAQPGAS